MVKIGDKIKITRAHEFDAYVKGDEMTVSELLKTKIIAVDKDGEEHALWEHCYELLNR